MKNKDDIIIKRLLVFFMVSLFVSGLTAIPLGGELEFLLKVMPANSTMSYWLRKVLWAWRNVSRQSPFLFYGYDWLAFAHFIVAIFFIGPYKDPVRNIWVIKSGLTACAFIFPMALFAGHFRGIPFGWQLIDCSFGGFGFITLWLCYRKIKHLGLKSK